MSLRAVLFTASRDWHARVLSFAIRRRGISLTTLQLESCAFDSAAQHGLRLGRYAVLPQGVLVRTVSAGTFEAVTRRLGILHALKALGVRVWNDPAAIERCVDKSATTFLLKRAGLSVPRTIAVESLQAARNVVSRETGPFVLKPLFGSQGRGLLLVRKTEDLPPADHMAGVYYLQRFVRSSGSGHRDYRIFVVEGEAVAAMAREGETWITNVKQGGRPIKVMLDRELSDIGVAAAAAVGASFCGVDVLRGRDGTLYVLEVNSMPAWSGLQSVCNIDIADVLAERFCAHLAAAAAARAA
jgi:RimK family alpha-L-glutamate ligase